MPMAFGIPLSQVIANDQAYKRRQDALKESRRDCLDLEASILRFRAEKRQFFNGNKPLVSSSSLGGGPSSPSANSVAPAPMFDPQNKPMSPTFLDNTGRGQRRVRQLSFYLEHAALFANGRSSINARGCLTLPTHENSLSVQTKK